MAWPAAADFSFRYDAQASLWKLGNGLVEAVFHHHADGRFEFHRLSDLSTGEIWAPGAGSSPIRFQVGSVNFDHRTVWKLGGQFRRPVPRNGFRQTIVLEEVAGNGQVTLELELYEGQTALQYRTRYRNSRGSRVYVRDYDLLPWTFAGEERTFRTFRVNQWVNYGKSGNFEPIANTLRPGGEGVVVRSGAHGQHCGWLAVRDQADRGLYAGWSFDGRADVAVKQQAGGDLELSGRILEMNRPVEPGQEFISPFAFLGMFRGDWDDAGHRTQRFAEAAIAQPVPDDDFPYVMWDSWKYQTNIHEDELMRNAELASRIGIEVFVVDLGWARHIGDWRPDPRKFPGGLRRLSDFVHSLGMKFGLHFPFAEAAAQAPVLMQNPSWRSTNSYGYFEAESLCLSHRPVRDWIIREGLRVIDEYGVDWILQDGENMVKRCVRTDHTHDPNDSNYANAVDGLNVVVNSIQQQRPQVHWENCEDGGNMMTFNMVRNYVTSIAADDSGPLTTRQAVYGITYPFSPRYADRYMPDEELGTYNTRSFMFGGPWIFMNRLTLMRPQDLALAASEIRLFKSIRKQVRDSRVFHLTGRPTETSFDVIQSYHEGLNSAVLFAYRGESPLDRRVVRLRGLRPEKRYRITAQEDPRRPVLTGERLIERGYDIRLPSMWSADIIRVDPVN
jgi:hypothetical protein